MKRIVLYIFLLLGAIVTFESCDVNIPEVENLFIQKRNLRYLMTRMIHQQIQVVYLTIRK